MNETETVELFAKISQCDSRRTFTDDDVVTWTEIAQVAGWNLPGALRAVVEHYAEFGRWVMPADITRYLRDPGQTGQRICEY